MNVKLWSWLHHLTLWSLNSLLGCWGYTNNVCNFPLKQQKHAHAHAHTTIHPIKGVAPDLAFKCQVWVLGSLLWSGVSDHDRIDVKNWTEAIDGTRKQQQTKQIEKINQETWADNAERHAIRKSSREARYFGRYEITNRQYFPILCFQISLYWQRGRQTETKKSILRNPFSQHYAQIN